MRPTQTHAQVSRRVWLALALAIFVGAAIGVLTQLAGSPILTTALAIVALGTVVAVVIARDRPIPRVSRSHEAASPRGRWRRVTLAAALAFLCAEWVSRLVLTPIEMRPAGGFRVEVVVAVALIAATGALAAAIAWWRRARRRRRERLIVARRPGTTLVWVVLDEARSRPALIPDKVDARTPIALLVTPEALELWPREPGSLTGPSASIPWNLVTGAWVGPVHASGLVDRPSLQLGLRDLEGGEEVLPMLVVEGHGALPAAVAGAALIAAVEDSLVVQRAAGL